MIKMLRAVRNMKTYTPFGKMGQFRDLNSTPRTCSKFNKLGILAENYLFARYLLLLEPQRRFYTDFFNSVKRAISNHVNDPKLNDLGIDSDKYLYYKNIFGRLLHSDTDTNALRSLYIMLGDPRFINDFRQLPTEFTDPLFHTLGCFPSGAQIEPGKKNVTISAPQLLFPHVYADKGNVYVTYTSQTFPSYEFSPVNNTSNPLLGYLSRFNWKGKEYSDVLSTVSQLALDANLQDIRNIPTTVHKALMLIGSHKQMLEQSNRTLIEFLQFTQKLVSRDNTSKPGLKGFTRFLSKFEGYDDLIMYMNAKQPTLAQYQDAMRHPETQFLLGAKEALKTSSIYGKEDAGDDTEDGEGGGDDDFGLGDLGDDFDFGDGDSGDDSGGDGDDSSSDDSDGGDSYSSSGSDYSSSDGTATRETDTQPSDPSAIAYEVMVLDPTLETIVYRRKMETVLRSIVKNPPASLSSEQVQALKIWLTEELYVVAPSVTKRFLAQVFASMTHTSVVSD